MEFKFRYFDLQEVHEYAKLSALSLREAEMKLLENGIVPLRYSGTVRFIGVEGMFKLLQSAVGIAGAGGVGALVCELLARFGVGKLIIADSDMFDETNLNRQLYCTEHNIGMSKAEAVRERIQIINSAIEVRAHHVCLDETNITAVFAGAQCLVDDVDVLGTRLALANGAKTLKIPLIHGAIGNSIARVMLVPPGSDVILRMYSPENECDQTKGTPPATAYLCAVLQAAETIKVLLNTGETLCEKLLQLDWLNCESVILDMQIE